MTIEMGANPQTSTQTKYVYQTWNSTGIRHGLCFFFRMEFGAIQTNKTLSFLPKICKRTNILYIYENKSISYLKNTFFVWNYP